MVRWFAHLPIERKLRVVIMLPATVAFGIALAMHVTTNCMHLRADILRRAARVARVVGVPAIVAARAGDRQAAAAALDVLRDEPMMSAAEVYLADGAWVAAFAAAPAARAPVPLDPSQPRILFQQGRLHVTAPVLAGGRVLGFVHIVVLPAALFGDWPGYLAVILAAIGAAAAVSFWLAARLQRQISGPIVDLVHTMQRVSAEEDYSLRVERTTQDEIGSLIDGFNRMLAQVRHRDSRLERYREFLEQQVAERTVTLGNANRGLQQAIDEANRAKEAAERASNAKSEFLARMSHEIRTPLNGVMGLSELLQGTELTPRQRRLSETISRSAEALLEIINDVLDFSKIEAGRLELEHIGFKLRDALEDTVEICAGRAHAKGLELACVIESGVPAAVSSDPMRLRQVLINLLGNAIKFTATGEVVLRVKALDAAGLLRFEVTDTGIGISEAAQAHIFNAFSQADSFTTRKYGGTGLGLAICRQILTLMGGEIGVRSAVGAGSTFWFDVRLTPADVPTERGASSLAGTRALVVDDTAANREALAQHLASWGVTVDTASGGAAALAALLGDAAARFDLVLLDERMPDLGGVDVARIVRREPRLAGLRLVLLSSQESGNDGAECASLFDAVFAKPVRRAQLAKSLPPLLQAAPAAVPAGATAAAAADVADVAGVAGVVTAEPATAALPAPRRAASRNAAPLILVVEDNPINLEVATGMLQSLGYRTHAVDNGRSALDALYREPAGEPAGEPDCGQFAAVLMDCHMPLMDGLTATAEIRRRERAAGVPRVPIMALTANALDGDRERCLAAGMDDFLSKPFTQAQLGALLRRWLPDDAADAAAAPLLDGQVLEGIAALDKPALLASLIDLYLQHSPAQMGAVESAAAGAQPLALADAVHTLRSSTANLGGVRLALVAKECEVLARGGKLPEAVRLVDRLRREYQEFCRALTHERSAAAA